MRHWHATQQYLVTIYFKGIPYGRKEKVQALVCIPYTCTSPPTIPSPLHRPFCQSFFFLFVLELLFVLIFGPAIATVAGRRENIERRQCEEQGRRQIAWAEQQRRAYEMDDNRSAQFMYMPGADRGTYSITFTKGSNGRLGIKFAGDAVGQVAVRGFSRAECGDKKLPGERCGYIFERDVCIEVNGDDITTEDFAESMESIQYASWPRTFKFIRMAATWDSDDDENADRGYGPGAQEDIGSDDNVLRDPALLRPSNTPFTPSAGHALTQLSDAPGKWHPAVGPHDIPGELLHRDEQGIYPFLGGGVKRGLGRRGSRKKSKTEKRKEREARKREIAETAAKRGSTSRSGRKVNRVSYAEFDEDDFSDLSTSSAETEHQLCDPGENIERLVAKREVVGPSGRLWEYLVKYKMRSYLHCEWQSESLLNALGPRSRRVLQDYRRGDTKRSCATRIVRKGGMRASKKQGDKECDALDLYSGRHFELSFIEVEKPVIYFFAVALFILLFLTLSPHPPPPSRTVC